jgi:hypothetical protein
MNWVHALKTATNHFWHQYLNTNFGSLNKHLNKKTMKKIMMYFSCFMLAATVSFAQTEGTQSDNDYPKMLESKTMTDRLQTDWQKRNDSIQSQSVQWYELKDGYYGSYNNNSSDYMTLYDRDGNYIQTNRKGDWNTASASVKSQYDESNYKSQNVTSYWEVVDPGKTGYYFELTDDQGKPSRVWMNNTGVFATHVPKAKPKM